MDTISGQVNNLKAKSQLVIYVYSRGSWWVQPTSLHPFTEIGTDGSWNTLAHLGSQYAAVVVSPEYRPANTLRVLPQTGGSILFVKGVPGDPSSIKPERFLHFSGYDWKVRQLGGDTNGSPHSYEMSNVSVDEKGHLHLRVTKKGEHWSCAEVALPRSMGLGRYTALLEGAANLESATVFNMFTWDQAGTDQNRREMDTELARWGDPTGKNGEYSVQPFYRPTNTFRYSVPEKPLLLTMLWENGRVKFSTATSNEMGHADASLAEHTFTTDIPSPAMESIHLNLCTFDYGKQRQASDSEVVVKSFRYLP